VSESAALHLTSTSAATDAAWLAAADVATIARELGVEYRLIGGITITLLVHHHQVDHLVPARETADADMGVGFDVLADGAVPGALRRAGYTARSPTGSYVRTTSGASWSSTSSPRPTSGDCRPTRRTAPSWSTKYPA